MVLRKKSGLRRIDLQYMNRHIVSGEVINICSDDRCESGEDGEQVVFVIGDWVYSHGNNHTRRLFCPMCAYHQNLISEAQMLRCCPEAN